MEHTWREGEMMEKGVRKKKERSNIHSRKTSIEVVEQRRLYGNCKSYYCKGKGITPRASLEMTLTFGQMTVDPCFLLDGDVREAK
ncbi:hypothetical protein MTR_3g050590 [Medicago truncatula]|uniref:Uncharacterized protein n=1 Tax=Medicago truncatula TaxID=3880 RepID=G7J1Y2_MEDTR|nr:hypothetical protein MTR_3g050590 [Medicago truncatula]